MSNSRSEVRCRYSLTAQPAVLQEALNTKGGHPGKILATTQVAAEMTRLIGSQYVKILYDIYHMQINEGGICANIERLRQS